LSLPDTFRILANLRSARLLVQPRRLCRWGKIYGGVRGTSEAWPALIGDRPALLKGTLPGSEDR